MVILSSYFLFDVFTETASFLAMFILTTSYTNNTIFVLSCLNTVYGLSLLLPWPFL